MPREKSTPPTIHDDIRKTARDVYAKQWQTRIHPGLTPSEAKALVAQENTRTLRTRSGCVAVSRALGHYSTSLRRAASIAAHTIQEFWNSTIWTRLRKSTTSADSFPAAMSGPVKSFDVRFENVVYFARTVTESTPQNSKETMPTKTSKMLCVKSTETMESSHDFERIRDGLTDGTLDLSTISVQEWLEVSFLSMYGGEELHIDTKVISKGCVYHLHLCVQQVIPPGQQVARLKTKV